MEAPARRHPRPALERRLDAALAYRLTTLTAPAGGGKTELLVRWSAAVAAVGRRLTTEDAELSHLARGIVAALRLRVPDFPHDLASSIEAPRGPSPDGAATRPAVLADAIAAALHTTLRRHLVLVLDDVDLLPVGGPAARFLDALLHAAPPRLHLVVSSRRGPSFAVDRLRARGAVLEFTAADLTLDADEVRAWTRAAVGEDDALATAVLERTGGWPAAVSALLQGLRELPPGDRRAAIAAADAVPDLDDLVLAAWWTLDDDDRAVVALASVAPVVTPDLLSHVGLPVGAIDRLRDLGVFLQPHANEPDGTCLTAAARATLARAGALAPAALDEAAERAAGWALRGGRPDLALRTLLAVDRLDQLADLLVAVGVELATGGHIEPVMQALERLPPEVALQPTFRRIAGTALQSTGAWSRAAEVLTEVAATDAGDATVHWRLGLIHHMRGEFERALQVYEAGIEAAAPAADAAICTALAATVRWMRGERDRCADLADAALARASELDDDRALASAHIVQAMLAALDGDRRANDAHYLRALEHAERAGDVLQQIRIRVNRGSQHLEEGAYTDALAELELAERLAELTGFTPYSALALSNRAEVLLRLGRLEEAAADAQDAVTGWQGLGSHLAGYGLTQLAAVRHLRGDRTGAEHAYRQAIAEAEADADVQGLVPALADLAALLADTQPDRAAELADRALRHGPGMGYVGARLAAARVALARDDRLAAREHLAEARATGEARRDRPGVAAALELTAALDRDVDLAERALAAWREIGDPIRSAGAELTVAELTDDPDAAAELADRVAAWSRASGCRHLDDRVAALRRRRSTARVEPLAVVTLGRFDVLRHGTPIPLTAWQSRKARDLLKLLVARRGAPVSRRWLSEQLWPDVDDRRRDRRLSVQLSTLRAVLDPDRTWPSGHVVVSHGGGVCLDLDHVVVDLDRFLREVEAARRAEADRGGSAAVGDTAGRGALARWRRAETLYTGDFCVEEGEAAWVVSPREEARAAYVRTVSRLAAADAEAGRFEDAVRRWLRVLEHEPYDERAHLGLVTALLRAGRRGEAWRRYRGYADRLAELGLEAEPFPAPEAAVAS